MRLCCDFRGVQTLLWEGKCPRAGEEACPGRSCVWWLPYFFLDRVLTFRGQKGAFGCVCGEAWRVCVFAQVFLHAPCLEEWRVACAWTVVADSHGHCHGHASLSGSGAPLRSHLAFSLVPVVPFTVFRYKSVSPSYVGLLALAVVPPGLAVRCDTWPGPWVAHCSCRSRCSCVSCPPDRTAGQQRLPRDHTWLSCFNGVSLFHGL